MEDREDLSALVADFIQMVIEEVERQEVDFIVDAALHNAGASSKEVAA